MPNTITRSLNLITAGLTLVGLAVTTAARAADDVRAWNVHTLNTLALSGQNNIVQTRSLAMVHAAIHDAVNAIEQRHEPYAFSFSAPSASPEAAIAAAAHGVLLGVIPNFGTPTQQATALAAANATYASSIAMIPERPQDRRDSLSARPLRRRFWRSAPGTGRASPRSPTSRWRGLDSGSQRRTRTLRIPRAAVQASRRPCFLAGAT